jgi:hypothetical protein
MDFATNTAGFIEEIIRHNLPWGEVVAGNFSGTGKEIAAFVDKGNDRTVLSLLSRAGNGEFQLKEVWDSGPGNWQATRMSKVAVGDFSGKGKTEIAVFYDYGNSRTGLWLFSADYSFQPQRLWDSGDGKWTASGMSKVVVGDFSGTGKSDIGVFYDYHEGTTGLWLFSASSTPPFQSEQVWDSGVGKWTAGRMSKVVVGDFSGKGKAQIAAFYDYGDYRTGLWWFSADYAFQPQQLWDSGEGKWPAGRMSQVAVGDFSATGKTEIAVFIDYHQSQTGLLLFSVDHAFQPQKVWDSGIGQWTACRMSKAVVGDFSATGKTEIAVFYNNDKQGALRLFSASSNPPFQPGQVWDSGTGNWKVTAMSEIMAGDFSGSGKMEIATFYNYELSTVGVWLFSEAGSNSFQPKQVWTGNLSSDALTARGVPA